MGNVIKSGYQGRVHREPVAIDLSDHLAQACAVLDDARREGIQIVDAARARADQIREKSKEAGYDHGYKEGLRKGEEIGRQEAFEEANRQFEQEHKHVVDTLSTALLELEKVKQDIDVTAERDLLEFAVKLICKMTFAVGSLNREAANQNLERALRLVGAQTDITVEVNPEDLASMKTFANQLLELSDSQQSSSVIAASDIARGGCRVHTNRTDIDATLETQTAIVTDLLLGSTMRESTRRAEDGNHTAVDADLFDTSRDDTEPSSSDQDTNGELEP